MGGDHPDRHRLTDAGHASDGDVLAEVRVPDPGAEGLSPLVGVDGWLPTDPTPLGGDGDEQPDKRLDVVLDHRSDRDC